MPVGSFVRGDAGDGVVHAADPQDATSACGGLPVALDIESRSFVPWSDGACERCSESLAPRHAPTPPDAANLDAHRDVVARAAEGSITVEEAGDAPAPHP